MLPVSIARLFGYVTGESQSPSEATLMGSDKRAVRFRQRPWLVLVATVGFAAGASAQTKVTLASPGSHINADLTIQGGGYGMADFSDSDALATKVSSESYTRRILMKFDTQNFIPANADIQSAQLHLVLKKAENKERRPLTAYYVNRSFVTGATNWFYFRPGQEWQTPGGDLGASFGTTYVDSSVGSTYRFDLTELVQRAVNGDFGSRYTRIALVDTGQRTNGNYREFHSTRASNAALRPRLIITYASAKPAPSPAPAPAPAPAPPRPPAPTTSATLRVMQWNVQKTRGSDGRCDPDRIAKTIAAQNVDVVSLNEVNFFSGACAWTFHMGEKLEGLLEQKTGVAWYRQDVNVNGGRTGYGNVLLSRHRPVSSSSTLLSHTRGVAQMGIVVNGRVVNVFSTHVEYYTSWWRPIQIADALRWMNSFSEPRILMGDFNTTPGTSDYSLLANKIEDAWATAQRGGTATAFNGTGATKDNVRFDYVFYSKVAALSLKSVTVPNPRVNGVAQSDHAPVLAVFNVN
jgi:endonuclease/exonuclease/phosphatase family metal-dependent hydrolase